MFGVVHLCGSVKQIWAVFALLFEMLWWKREKV